MAEWEEKLNTILGDPEAMGQILSLAQSLGLSSRPEQEDHSPEEGGQEGEQPPLSGGDPAMLRQSMALLSALGQEENDKRTALLTALKPFLKPERQASLDRAIQLQRLTKMARVAFRLLRDEGGDWDV